MAKGKTMWKCRNSKGYAGNFTINEKYRQVRVNKNGAHILICNDGSEFEILPCDISDFTKVEPKKAAPKKNVTPTQQIAQLKKDLAAEKKQSEEYKDMIGEQVQKVTELGNEVKFWEDEHRGAVEFGNDAKSKLSTMAEEAKEQGKELEELDITLTKSEHMTEQFKNEIYTLNRVIVKQAIQLADN